MAIWQDATVNSSTGLISLGAGPDIVRVLAPGYILAGNVTYVGFGGVQVIIGGGSGEPDPGSVTMEFDDEVNSFLIAVLDDF
jgi:hypothetical protein